MQCQQVIRFVFVSLRKLHAHHEFRQVLAEGDQRRTSGAPVLCRRDPSGRRIQPENGAISILAQDHLSGLAD